MTHHATRATRTLGIVGAAALILGAAAVHAQTRRQLHAARDAARRDPLTGLLNRDGWAEAAQHAITTVPITTVALIDVDKFKHVNDTHGHDRGDIVLCRLAHAINGIVGPRTISGRLGGDEFVLVVPHPIESLPGLIAGIPVSIGITTVLRTEDAAQAVSAALTEADRAMYRAKRNGGEQATHYDPQLDADTSTPGRAWQGLADMLRNGGVAR